MIRLKLLNVYDEDTARPKELWFSSPEKVDAYLDKALADNPGLDYELDDISGLVDPEPPEPVTIYTAIWRPNEISTDTALMSPAEGAALPALSVTTGAADFGLHPLTRARWPQLAGQFRVVAVTGADPDVAGAELERTVGELRAQGKLVDVEVLRQVLVDNQAEYDQWIAPIDAARDRLDRLDATNFLGINTGELAIAQRDLFELIDKTNRHYNEQFEAMGHPVGSAYPAGRPLDIAVAAAAAFADAGSAMIADAVRVERDAGASWQSIGDLLDISRQAAYTRYAELVREDPDNPSLDLFLVSKSVDGQIVREYWFGRQTAVITVDTVMSTIERLAPDPARWTRPIVEYFLQNRDVLVSAAVGATATGRTMHLQRTRK